MVRNLWWSLVKFGFRLLYNELAFTYDTVSSIVSLGAWRCWQRTVLKHLEVEPGASILELAHGTGNLQLDLHALGYRTFGYDLSPYMGRIAQGKLKQSRFPVRLTRGRAQQLPYLSGAFAAVINTFPTNFILEPETLCEVHRVLRSGGQFLIVPNGVLTSGGAVEAGIEWLYRVTGQREDSGFNVKAFFQRFGFEAELLQEACPRSMATVIKLSKRRSGI